MDKDETGLERTCIVTRRKASPETMIRFVLSPEGSVVADLRRRLPGRGVWIGADRALVEKAVRTQVFARGFKTKAKAEPQLASEIEAMLERDALQSLAMANKAGLVTTGFAKVEAALRAGGVRVLLHAAEAGADGVRKLDAASRRHGDGAMAPVAIKVFSVGQLDLALGRTNVIHAALAVGPASDAFLTRCRRSINYREGPAQSNPEAAAAAGP